MATKKTFRRISVLFAVVAAAALAIHFATSKGIKETAEVKITEWIETLKDDSIFISYDTLISDYPFDDIEIRNLEIKYLFADSLHAPYLKAALIKIKGKDILTMVIRHKLTFQSALIENVICRNPGKFRMPASQGKKKINIESIDLGELKIRNGRLEFTDSAKGDAATNINYNFEVVNFKIPDLKKDNLEWEVESASASDVEIDMQASFRTFKMKRATYTALTRQCRFDSLQFKPVYDKVTFTHKHKYKTDWISLAFPSVQLDGFEMKMVNGDFSASATKAALSLYAEIYADNRMPSRIKTPRPLPTRLLRGLPFHLNIATVHVSDSHIKYEEVAKDGNKPGLIWFDKFTADYVNFSDSSSAPATIKARANFMSAGWLEGTFIFPASPDGMYSVNGSLTNFPLPSMNQALQPLAQAEIVSGFLDEMKVDFQYNDVRSDGTVVMNYTDLNINSNKSSPLMGLLLDLLVKKNVDERKSIAKRTGTISFERDTQKSVFNLWWKSILSGFKSVQNIPGKKKK